MCRLLTLLRALLMPKTRLSFSPFIGGIAAGADETAPAGLARSGHSFDPLGAGGEVRLYADDTDIGARGLTTDPAAGDAMYAVRGAGYVALATTDEVRFIWTDDGGATYEEEAVAVDGLEVGTTVGRPLVSGSAHNDEIRVGSVTKDPVRVAFNDGSPTVSPTTIFPSSILFVPREAPAMTTSDFSSTIAGDENFTAGRYDYGVSFVYDGVQESPLTAVSSHVLGSATEEMAFTLKWNRTASTVASVAARITHVNLYRRDYAGASFDSLRSAWRLVEEIKVEDFETTVDPDVDDYDVTDTGLVGPTFESNAGFAETLLTLDVGYRLSLNVDGYHVVADVRVLDRQGGDALDLSPEAASAMVMVSAPYQPDVIDWTTRWLRLPEPVVAMTDYRGRIFAFGARACYVIDPDAVALMETFDGFSVGNAEGVASGEGGVVAVGVDGHVRLFDGRQVLDLYDRMGDLGFVASAARALYYPSGNRFLIEKGTAGLPEFVVVRNEGGLTVSSFFLEDPGALEAFVLGTQNHPWVWHPANDFGPTELFTGGGLRSGLRWVSRMVDLPADRCKLYRVEIVARDAATTWAGELGVALSTDMEAGATTCTFAERRGARIVFDVPKASGAFREAGRVSLNVSGTIGFEELRLVYRPIQPSDHL